MMGISENLNRIYCFDEFQVDARRRILLRQGQPVTLHSKTFELLLALLDGGGRELSKDDLLSAVWRDQIVEENNLAVHIHNLRKILGERKDERRYIVTIPGHGYRFVGSVELQPDGSDLYVENRTVSRLVVEEETSIDEIESTADRDRLSEVKVHRVPTRQRSAVLTFAAVGLIAAGGFGAYWGSKILSRSSTVAAHPRPMMITRLTDGKKIAAPAISPDGKFIAYGVNATDGPGTLFIQQTDTNRVLQLLDADDRTFGAINFSPDGSLIYYIVFDKQDPYGALYRVSVLGGAPKRIVTKLGGYFSLSGDGNQVAFYRNEPENKRRSLLVATVDGSKEKVVLTRPHNEMAFGGSLAWSPDGTLVAFSGDGRPSDRQSGHQLFGVDVNTGTTRPLAPDQFVTIGKISWTSDGRNLVFVAKELNKPNQLYLMDYPTGLVRRVTNDLQAYGNYGLGVTADSSTMIADIYETTAELWSVPASGDTGKAVRVKSGARSGLYGITALPNGRIVYVTRTDGNLDIWVVGEDGSDSKPLTTDETKQTDVASTPDGRYLVYAAGGVGEKHIFRMNAADGSEVTQLTFGTTSDSEPDVSPDGNFVLFARSRGGKSTIWKVPIGGGSTQPLTDYFSLAPQYSPDGKLIACILPSDSRAKLATIAILNAEGGKPTTSFPVMPFGYAEYPYRWAPDGKSVVFRRVTNGISDLWLQSLSGGEPRQLTNFQSGAIWTFVYSRDGSRIFLSRGETYTDAVVIKNFR